MKIVMNDGDERDVKDHRAFELVNTGAAKVADPDAQVEVPSPLVSEQEARLAYAETEYATPQEKRQAALEREGLKTGSHARLHQTDLPALAVPDQGHAEAIELDADELYRNKGPAEVRPDSAGYKGLPDSAPGEAVTPLSGPAKDVGSGTADVPDVTSAAKNAKARQQAADDTDKTPSAKAAGPKADK